jgi:hypothetical protein
VRVLEPEGQPMQVVARSIVLYFPESHALQVLELFFEAYLPGEQEEQAWEASQD